MKRKRNKKEERKESKVRERKEFKGKRNKRKEQTEKTRTKRGQTDGKTDRQSGGVPDAEAAGKTMSNISSEVRRWKERRAAATVNQPLSYL